MCNVIVLQRRDDGQDKRGDDGQSFLQQHAQTLHYRVPTVNRRLWVKPLARPSMKTKPKPHHRLMQKPQASSRASSDRFRNVAHRVCTRTRLALYSHSHGGYRRLFVHFISTLASVGDRRTSSPISSLLFKFTFLVNDYVPLTLT